MPDESAMAPVATAPDRPFKRALYVCVRFPQNLGAEHHDLLCGLERLTRCVEEVSVLILEPHGLPQSLEGEPGRRLAGLRLRCVQPARPPRARWGLRLRRLLAAPGRNLGLLDGAAFGMALPEYEAAFAAELAAFAPDLVWLHTSALWPYIEPARRAGARVVVRSTNFEPAHCLDENGRSPANRARAFFKTLGERRCVREADALAAITPVDQAAYGRLGSWPVHLLPLQGLPDTLRPVRTVGDKPVLDVFFMGSTFNVPHIREAAAWILTAIVPAVRRAAPGAFRFHLLGGKFPPSLLGHVADDVRVHGYVPDLEAFLVGMDIALVPSLFGSGMQQKIFEPICRGIPTITASRGLAGYDLRPGEHVLVADDVEAIVARLLLLRSPEARAALGEAGLARCRALFSAPSLDQAVTAILASAATRGHPAC